MSYGEGYELFMCPECESNFYWPGSRCGCGYSTQAPPEQAMFRPRRTVRLLEVARRDERRRATLPLLQLVHSMPATKGRKFEKWSPVIESLLSSIYDQPILLSQHGGTKALRDVYALLVSKEDEKSRLEPFFTACTAVLTAIEAKLAPPSVAPDPTPKSRRRRKRNRRPSRGRASAKANTSLWHQLDSTEQHVQRRLEEALQTRGLPKLPNPRLAYPRGKLIAQLPLTEPLDPQEARQKVNQGLAEAVGWKGDWNTGSDEASARIFRNWVYDYSLVLDFTSKTAYLTRLH